MARAAADLAEHGEPVLLGALRKHQTLPGISVLAVFTTARDYASEGFVDAVADIVLNPATWSANTVYVDPLLKSLVEGLNSANYAPRLMLLCYKLRRIQRNNPNRVSFYIDYGEDLEHPPDYLRREPFYALMRTLVESLRKASGWASATELLQAISALPDDLKGRVRTWLLANASSVEPADLIQEVAKAIRSRFITKDDVRVLDRAVAECDTDDYQDMWASALGVPPTVAELGTALANDQVPAPWRRAFGWNAVLPPAVTQSWNAAIAIMSAAYGQQPVRPSLDGPIP